MRRRHTTYPQSPSESTEPRSSSSYDDWLWRGDHPVVRDLSWYVYSMWFFRVETKTPLDKRSELHRYVEIEFAEHYRFHRTHVQRRG